MRKNLTPEQLAAELSELENQIPKSSAEYDFWSRIRISATKWSHSQYKDIDSFWVVAILADECLYFNFVEAGWGWGQYTNYGSIDSYHWQQDDLYFQVNQKFTETKD